MQTSAGPSWRRRLQACRALHLLSSLGRVAESLLCPSQRPTPHQQALPRPVAAPRASSDCRWPLLRMCCV